MYLTCGSITILYYVLVYYWLYDAKKKCEANDKLLLDVDMLYRWLHRTEVDDMLFHM